MPYYDFASIHIQLKQNYSQTNSLIRVLDKRQHHVDAECVLVADRRLTGRHAPERERLLDFGRSGARHRLGANARHDRLRPGQGGRPPARQEFGA